MFLHSGRYHTGLLRAHGFPTIHSTTGRVRYKDTTCHYCRPRRLLRHPAIPPSRCFTMPPKRRAEAIDLTDDSPSYSPSQGHAHASSSQHPSSSHGYAHSQSSPTARAPKQPRTATYNRAASGASQQDPVYIDDDDEEDASATQGMSEQEYGWTLYGVMHGKIVGVRFYNGYATVGEMVVVRREPNNQYDRESFTHGVIARTFAYMR